jgi:hypothetical protein
MEISNPIALQYVTNKGLASQLNAQNKQLPVKSDRFAVENKVPAPTEDEERLRSEADKKKTQSANINENDNLNKTGEEQGNNSSTSQNQLFNPNQTTFPLSPVTPRNLAENSNLSQQITSEQDAAVLSKEKEQLSGPIQSYLETSALSSKPTNLARIDYFI